MKIPRDRRSKQDHALQVRFSRRPQSADKIVNRFFRNHSFPRWLPAATAPATTRTATAEASKTTATAKHSGKQNPEKQAAKRSDENDDNDDNQQNDSAGRHAPARLLHRSRCELWGSKLDSGILCDDVGHARGHQQQCLAIVSTAHERDRLPLKRSDLAVSQDRLQSIANLNARAMVIDRIKDQYPSVLGFAAHAPLME